MATGTWHSIRLFFFLLSIVVFLRPQRNLESIDPQFTIRRKMEQMREEKEVVEQLREVPKKHSITEQSFSELKQHPIFLKNRL